MAPQQLPPPPQAPGELAPAESPSTFFTLADLPIAPAAPARPESTATIERFAQLVLAQGVDFERRALDDAKSRAVLPFLQPADPDHAFYRYRLYTLWQEREATRRADHAAEVAAYEAALARYRQQQQQQQLQIQQQMQMQRQQQQQQESRRAEFAPLSSPQQQMQMQQQRGGGGGGNMPSGTNLAAAVAAPPSNCTILTRDESAALCAMLRDLTPKKDSIMGVCEWIFARANRAAQIFEMLRFEMEDTHSFEKKLSLVFVMNEVLRHGARDPAHHDACTDALRSTLPGLMAICRRGLGPDEVDKIAKVLDIWADRQFYSPDFVHSLQDILRGSDAPPAPPVPSRGGGSSNRGGGGSSSVSQLIGSIRSSVDAEQRHHSHAHSRGHSHGRDRDRDRDRERERERDRDRDGSPHRKRSRFDS